MLVNKNKPMRNTIISPLNLIGSLLYAQRQGKIYVHRDRISIAIRLRKEKEQGNRQKKNGRHKGGPSNRVSRETFREERLQGDEKNQ
jgi:hypothetical protein